MNIKLFKKLEKFHFEAQQGVWLSNAIKMEVATILYSDFIDDYYWNFAIGIKANTQEEFVKSWIKVKEKFLQIKRTPVLYITETNSLYKNINKILSSNFKKVYHDSWMLLKDINSYVSYKSTLDLTIKRIKDSEKSLFADTLIKGFSSEDPNDPYGEISSTYRDAFMASTKENKLGYKAVHYIAKLNSDPVSIATAIYKGSIAVLYNITTLKEYQKQGVSKELLSVIFKELKLLGVKQVFLQTEKGFYVEKIYKNLGFELVGEAFCYIESSD